MSTDTLRGRPPRIRRPGKSNILHLNISFQNRESESNQEKQPEQQTKQNTHAKIFSSFQNRTLPHRGVRGLYGQTSYHNLEAQLCEHRKRSTLILFRKNTAEQRCETPAHRIKRIVCPKTSSGNTSFEGQTIFLFVFIRDKVNSRAQALQLNERRTKDEKQHPLKAADHPCCRT